MTLWWCYPGDQGSGPFDIAITRADTPQAACAAFGEAFPSPCVHELKAPLLQELFAALTPQEVRAHHTDKLPSFYDQYRRPRNRHGGGYDVHRLARDDIDVS